MKDAQRSFIEHIETLFDAGAIGEPTDRQLLERFNGRDRKAAELAFTTLVRRHGPMVFRACRAILHDPHASEDAFQATFLVLSRKATGLWVRGSLGPWLMEVACRVASAARAEAMRRRVHERKAAELSTPASDDASWDDRDAILHEELGRLPEKYRTAVVLCDLEGLTQEQAARHLGWPAGTVRSRLSCRAGSSYATDCPGARLAPDGRPRGAVGRMIEWNSASGPGGDDRPGRPEARVGPGGDRVDGVGHRPDRRSAEDDVVDQAQDVRGHRAGRSTAFRRRPDGLPGDGACAGLQRPRTDNNRRQAGPVPEKSRPFRLASGARVPRPPDAIGKARLEVAQQIRDAAEKLWREGRDQPRGVSHPSEALRRSCCRCRCEDRGRPRPVPRATGGHAQADRGSRPKAVREGSSQAVRICSRPSWPGSTPSTPWP